MHSEVLIQQPIHECHWLNSPPQIHSIGLKKKRESSEDVLVTGRRDLEEHCCLLPLSLAQKNT